MPTYLLNDRDRTTIARRPVQVSVTVDGREGSVALAALRGHGHDASAIRPRPSFMILPRITDRTVIRVVPLNGAAVFPAATVVSMSLRTEEQRDVEPDVVVVQAVDVSGLAHRDLAAVDVDGAWLSVSAINAVEDMAIGKLPEAARAAARAALGGDRVPDELAVDLVVAIDLSASMAPAIRDGSVRAVTEVVAGLSQVIGWGRQLAVCLLGERPQWLPAVPVAELATATVQAITEAGLESGFRSSPVALQPPPGAGRTVTFIVTDALPPDLDVLGSCCTDSDVRHLVTITEAGGTGERLPVPYTLFGPPPVHTDAVEYLLRSPRHLAALVAALVVGCLPDRADAVATARG